MNAATKSSNGDCAADKGTDALTMRHLNGRHVADEGARRRSARTADLRWMREWRRLRPFVPTLFIKNILLVWLSWSGIECFAGMA